MSLRHVLDVPDVPAEGSKAPRADLSVLGARVTALPQRPPAPQVLSLATLGKKTDAVGGGKGADAGKEEELTASEHDLALSVHELIDEGESMKEVNAWVAIGKMGARQAKTEAKLLEAFLARPPFDKEKGAKLVTMTRTKIESWRPWGSGFNNKGKESQAGVGQVK